MSGHAGDALSRFDAKWIPEPNTGCHLWIGASNPRLGRAEAVS